jgi:hypothetical protein
MVELYVWSSCMYGRVVCMVESYVWSSCMYGRVVCMVESYVWSSCMHSRVLCMVEFLQTDDSWCCLRTAARMSDATGDWTSFEQPDWEEWAIVSVSIVCACVPELACGCAFEI